MKLLAGVRAPQALLAMFLAAAPLAVQAAERGVSIKRTQEFSVKAGMTAAEVQQALGRPATRFRFRAAEGPTWTYNIVESTPGTVFLDVDFGPDGRVASKRVRVGPGPG